MLLDLKDVVLGQSFKLDRRNVGHMSQQWHIKDLSLLNDVPSIGLMFAASHNNDDLSI